MSFDLHVYLIYFIEFFIIQSSDNYGLTCMIWHQKYLSQLQKIPLLDIVMF